MNILAFVFAALVVCAELGYAQGPAMPPAPATAPASVPQGGLMLPQAGGNFQGSVAAAQPATSLRLSLQDALDRGLRNNLGLLVTQTGSRIASIERRRALAALLPTVGGQVIETEQQIDLASFGFHFPGVPSVIGPFHYFDAQASLSQKIFDWTSIKNRQSAIQSERAAELSVKDARDLVVQAVASAYLAIIADGARVSAAQAEVDTAQALYNRARDQHQAGVSPAIDELRAQVELRTRQQQLLAAANQLDKDKLALGRVIGLPDGQSFELADTAPYVPLEAMTPRQAIERAHKNRADYQSAMLQVRAAETAREAAVAERYPAAQVDADYGAIGVAPNSSHGVFTVSGGVRFNIFDAGRIRADIEQADAVIKQRKDELANLEAQIGYQIRTALLDLKTAADQVSVAQDNLSLANQTLAQARDRFSAGVADNLEVVQAQDSVAAANESLISAIYLHNVAKVSLARAVGEAETSLKEFMGGK
ncbi:MAG TPA: TolC family protein [Bryobacteraceae bacterium]|jgi:outer membrane protein TolC|nr:TolC family protein [Bryobacteraceae bacterium]